MFAYGKEPRSVCALPWNENIGLNDSRMHPSLIYHEMSKAYERGIQKIWVLNVGDIKPLEYQIELFLDLAWNPEAIKQQGVKAHLKAFLPI